MLQLPLCFKCELSRCMLHVRYGMTLQLYSINDRMWHNVSALASKSMLVLAGKLNITNMNIKLYWKFIQDYPFQNQSPDGVASRNDVGHSPTEWHCKDMNCSSRVLPLLDPHHACANDEGVCFHLCQCSCSNGIWGGMRDWWGWWEDW